MGPLARSMSFFASCVVLGACGTLLGINPDPPDVGVGPGADGSSADAVTADVNSGDAGDVGDASGDGASPGDGGTDAAKPPDQHYVTNFDPPEDAVSHYGWDDEVSAGGTFIVEQSHVSSPPNSAHVDATGSNFLQRSIDGRVKDLTVTLPFFVEQYPPTNTGSSVDIIAVGCGIGVPFARVQLHYGGTIGLANDTTTSPVAVSTGTFHTVVLHVVQSAGAFAIDVRRDGSFAGTLTAPTCGQTLFVHVGASYTSGQLPPGMSNDLVYDIDDIKVDALF